MSVTIKQSNPDWFKKLIKRYSGDNEIAVGFPVGSESAGLSYPGGQKVVDVAAMNEFGIGVPERSFLRAGGREFVETSKSLFEKAVIKINEGGSNIEDESEKIGLKASAFIKQKIVDLKDPPNSEETVRRKGSSNPLVDTGLMRQSVTHVVR